MTYSVQDLAALAHVENFRLLGMIKDPNQKSVFEGTQRLAQCWKSKLRITCNVMELKVTSTP